MDYCTYALESLLKDQKVQQLMEANHLVEESNFICECLNNGYISLENMQFTPVNEGMADSLVEFFNKIISHFKTKSVERSKKYIPWLKDHRDEIKERASKTGSLKLSPLWEGNWDSDGKEIVNAIRTAYDNYGRGEYTNYSFTKKFLDSEKVLTDEGTAVLTDSFKQYYRYGIKRATRLDDVTVNGAKLAELIDGMIDYLINFDTKVVGNVTKINDQITRSLKTIKDNSGESLVSNTVKANADVPAKEGLSADTWLSIEQRPVSESMLTILANYKSLTEADEPKEKTADQKKEEDTGNVKQVEKVEDNKTDTGEEKTSGDSAAAKYLENVNTFARFAVSAYQTVLDERYILYINICKTIGDASGKGPTFDKNGNYISKKDKDATDTTKVNATEETPKKSSKVLGKLRK